MSKNSISKILVFWVIFTVMFIFALSESHFMQKTISGERFEYFTTIDSRFLPQVLSDYMKRNYVKYRFYKIPNYVKELFKYHKDFYPIYNSGKKHTVIVFAPLNRNSLLTPFFNKLSTEVKKHQDEFNLIKISSDKKNSQLYKTAYKDLRSYCKNFCIIDPERNTLFTFSRITNTEMDALGIVFQEFSYIAK